MASKIITTGWSSRSAFAELDLPVDGSTTNLSVEISSPGTSNETEAMKLTICVRGNPGCLQDEELRVDLRGQDFRPLLAVLERAVVEAEGAGILEPTGLGVLLGVPTETYSPRRPAKSLR
jgi:hypothetical protein